MRLPTTAKMYNTSSIGFEERGSTCTRETMLRQWRTLFSLVASFVWPATLSSQSAEWSALTRVVQAHADSQRIPGGGIALLRDGGLVAQHAWGIADRTNGQRITEATLFHWASITKVVTA